MIKYVIESNFKITVQVAKNKNIAIFYFFWFLKKNKILVQFDVTEWEK